MKGGSPQPPGNHKNPLENAVARNLYYQLLDASPEDQVLVYRALRARLADDVPAEERQERGLQCARACAWDTRPGLAVQEDLRRLAQLTARSDRVAVKQIRAHFGSYPSAAKTAQRFWATQEG